MIFMFDENSAATLEQYQQHPLVFIPTISLNSMPIDIVRQLSIHNIIESTNCRIVLISDYNEKYYNLIAELNINHSHISILILSDAGISNRNIWWWTSLIVNVIDNNEFLLKNNIQ